MKLFDMNHFNIGDSSGLQKGLELYFRDRSLSGEGIGFGSVAIEYPNDVIFSSTASISKKNDALVKNFEIDTILRRNWKGKFYVDNRFYGTLLPKLTKIYRENKKARPLLNALIRIQSLIGVRLSHQKIETKGQIRIVYSLIGDQLKISVDSTGLIDKKIQKILIFNEQSSDFNIYEEEGKTLTNDEIGVWQEVKSKKACLSNIAANVKFCLEEIPGTVLFRGRESLRPRLNWSGFCYSIPKRIECFTYNIHLKR
ncbi:MAG: hypothetical protein NWF08_04595 [Candidatus Bathyarchaeota archaeon]|nr:hypothetical protein [Candidatus Bathyarchaeota archaeon]